MKAVEAAVIDPTEVLTCAVQNADPLALFPTFEKPGEGAHNFSPARGVGPLRGSVS